MKPERLGITFSFSEHDGSARTRGLETVESTLVVAIFARLPAPDAPLGPDFAKIVAAAHRLTHREVEAQVREVEAGPQLVLVIQEAEAAEGVLLERALKEDCDRRGIKAHFVVVGWSPARFVSKDPKPPTHWPPTP